MISPEHSRLLNDLDTKSEFRKNKAIQELSKISDSCPEIVAALTFVQHFDENQTSRDAAAISLLMPVHQACIRQQTDAVNQACAAYYQAHQQKQYDDAVQRQMAHVNMLYATQTESLKKSNAVLPRLFGTIMLSLGLFSCSLLYCGAQMDLYGVPIGPVLGFILIAVGLSLVTRK